MDLAPNRNPQYLPVFAYGTLLPGQPNYHIWAEAIRSGRRATYIGGRLYDMGFYPMLVEEEGGEVAGMAFTIRPAIFVQTLARLDLLEGYRPEDPEASAYKRVQRSVQLSGGGTAAVWLYVGDSGYLNGAPHIAGGDWTRHASNKMRTIKHWWNGIDTVHGLHG